MKYLVHIYSTVVYLSVTYVDIMADELLLQTKAKKPPQLQGSFHLVVVAIHLCGLSSQMFHFGEKHNELVFPPNQWHPSTPGRALKKTLKINRFLYYSKSVRVLSGNRTSCLHFIAVRQHWWGDWSWDGNDGEEEKDYACQTESIQWAGCSNVCSKS